MACNSALHKLQFGLLKQICTLQTSQIAWILARIKPPAGVTLPLNGRRACRLFLKVHRWVSTQAAAAVHHKQHAKQRAHCHIMVCCSPDRYVHKPSGQPLTLDTSVTCRHPLQHALVMRFALCGVACMRRTDKCATHSSASGGACRSQQFNECSRSCGVCHAPLPRCGHGRPW